MQIRVPSAPRASGPGSSVPGGFRDSSGWIRSADPDSRRALLARGLLQSAALVEILDRLSAAGIEALTFKGPALGLLLHGDATSREADDIDVLVRPRDFAGARRIAESLGYAAGIALPGASLRAPAGKTQIPFVRADGVVLDLHWRLAPPYDSFSLDDEDLFGESAEVLLEGRPVRVLGPDHHFLYLAFHGGKSLWKRARWVADIAEFLESGPPVDPIRVTAIAERTGALRMLALALELARRVHGLPPGAADAGWPTPDAEVRRMASLFHGALRRGEAPCRDPSSETDLHLRMRERPRDRARFLLGLSFTPTPREREMDRHGLLRPVTGGFRLAHSMAVQDRKSTRLNSSH